ncbi:RusA family crossover junction endodeoxyribonuclease [Gimesia aquarii]|uniref:Endodeoxyribonuclease RusA n=1 Tax=Gimesia aquarii TaxID=2527964 RepID=A0A517VTC0_9PLAN|nr:RusA family crossover junction endodeoxyribonuclease [Gimesia aquarii]QDT96261.1 Endodeoxyribonuclease RusA [Gimesia aquarii]QDU11270.1 Endodeoxyribonuclease RusA [Gimesia aquarii]
MSDNGEPLIEALEEADAGVAPSPFGELSVKIPGAPASIQSKKAQRNAYIAQIKTELSKFQFILTGQIILEITWNVPAKSRYETDAKADIDNCLKPIIDAFTGPDGIMIDDCQLKGLYISWTHINSGDEYLHFQFKFDSDHYCERDDLVFIRLEKGLRCPVNTNWPKELKTIWVKAIQAGEDLKAILENENVSYLTLASMTGGAQPFHATRTVGFRDLSPEEFAGET